MLARRIRIRGIVQGVGFRPYIWHLAHTHALTGEVWNDGEGVGVLIFGDAAAFSAFLQDLPLQLPPLARVDSIEVEALTWDDVPLDFQIVDSRAGLTNTPISADAATCAACLAELADPLDRRYRYPFSNCTHCGPRLSIVRQIPYDRAHTSMAEFPLCSACQNEFNAPSNRRFHAQATCCPDCGPILRLENHQGVAQSCADAMQYTAELLQQGFIVAIKGIGGFHLACNANDDTAVARLRQRKQRYAKPLAIMARDLEQLANYVSLQALEIEALQSKAAPIVLLKKQGKALAPSVAPEQATLGCMLPYTPLHSLLLQALEHPIVLTSANVSDAPQCTRNAEAYEKLANIADYFLIHDREIENRLDDSVLRLMGGAMRVLRRARGYSPEALLLPAGFANTPSILAVGAELKNSFCLLQHGQAIVSQHIGDLTEASVLEDFQHTLQLYQNLFGFAAQGIAVDQHPGYLASQLGAAWADSANIPVFPVQHHHAHLAACLIEQQFDINSPPVLAAIFDGLGMGADGKFWGGEFLLGDYRSCTRLGHFAEIALLGGNQAMREPWRNCYAQLLRYFTWEELIKDYADLPIMRLLSSKPLATCNSMLAKNLNSPLSSSAGRWFDAFAAALGLHAEHIAYEGQAAMALETLAASKFSMTTAYPEAYTLSQSTAGIELRWQGLWLAVFNDLKSGVELAEIAARIHHSIIAATVAVIKYLSAQTGIHTVVLSGGVFQNQLLLEGVSKQLQQSGKQVLIPKAYPMNDGGIALGQAVIAAANQSRYAR